MSKKTIKCCFLFFALLAIGTGIFFYLGQQQKNIENNTPENVGYIEKTLSIKMRPVPNNEWFYRNDAYTIRCQMDAQKEYIGINLRPKSSEQVDIKSIEKIVHKHFRDWNGEIDKALEDNCLKVKNGVFTNGKIEYQKGTEGKGPYLDITTWQDYDGTVYICMLLPF
ncbi:hypothetical protein DCCM_3276 [Desulfocucumis palustris]|uniref:Uncharacterized protein n=1 Tax=Desulfocucumis palustris TaxID=1898651 RepID=A0A2L2XDR3_9FIRM|nr:hypothetical protein [Desulfocucumis palustris]GBF34164.1 hypothetical protein DCCM_3276 [Desulfocucumis palustris]